ncbi:hypothetical protein NL676_033347 [Syzygium grande]|nr:hypothetical protein NL676_033347 [Syzygium grande]
MKIGLVRFLGESMKLVKGGGERVRRGRGGGQGWAHVVKWDGAKVGDGETRGKDEYGDDKMEGEWRHRGGD